MCYWIVIRNIVSILVLMEYDLKVVFEDGKRVKKWGFNPCSNGI